MWIKVTRIKVKKSEVDRVLKTNQHVKVLCIHKIAAEVLQSMGNKDEEKLFQLIRKIYKTGDIPLGYTKIVIYTRSKKVHTDRCEYH